MASVFEMTQRPDSSLFFRRDEEGDPRWGEKVWFAAERYADAKVILVGCPQDEGVRRNGGRLGSAKGPAAIRACFYRLAATATDGLFDLGDTKIQSSLEDTHRLHQTVIEQILADGKRVIVLGGGNDISYPDCAALSNSVSAENLLAFNVDAHLDVRQSESRHSGTPYRMLLEEGFLKPSNFHEIAYQPFAVAESHVAYVRGKGAQALSLPDLRPNGVGGTLTGLVNNSTATNVFWGIDMDSVRAADAPGVSAPNPLGLSAEELCDIAAIAGAERRTRIFEVSEMNPAFDIDQRTARLAAVAVHQFLRMCL